MMTSLACKLDIATQSAESALEQRFRSALSKTAAPYDPILIQQELSSFMGVVHHDVRGNNGGYIIRLVRTASGKLVYNSESRWRLVNTQMYPQTYNKQTDTYYTVNTFTSGSRKSESCFQVVGILIDLDAHDYKDRIEFGAKLSKTLYVIFQLIEAKVIPNPTAIVFTGRGIQLHYTYLRSISYRTKDGSINSLVKAHTKACDILYALFKRYLPEDGLSLDQSCKDIARCCRVPSSYNTKSKSVARLIDLSGEYHDLFTILDNFSEAAPSKNISLRRGISADNLSSGLLRNRLQTIMGLITSASKPGSQLVGYRHMLLFHAFNILFQLYEFPSAVEELNRINRNLPCPLTAAEIRSISNSFRNRSQTDGYKYSDVHFYADMKSIAKIIGCDVKRYKSDHHLSAREIARKHKRESKQAQIHKAHEMYANGVQIKDIAAACGCHRNTVRNWLNKRVRCDSQDTVCVTKVVQFKGTNPKSDTGNTSAVCNRTALSCSNTKAPKDPSLTNVIPMRPAKPSYTTEVECAADLDALVTKVERAMRTLYHSKSSKYELCTKTASMYVVCMDNILDSYRLEGYLDADCFTSAHHTLAQFRTVISGGHAEIQCSIPEHLTSATQQYCYAVYLYRLALDYILSISPNRLRSELLVDKRVWLDLIRSPKAWTSLPKYGSYRALLTQWLETILDMYCRIFASIQTTQKNFALR